MPLTDAQLAYLASQRLGRLATVDSRGAPQNNPVSFRYNADLGTIDIGGRAMGASRKFRNVAANPNVALVVDDIASLQPWKVRCVEIRGHAEALTDQAAPRPGFSAEIIRIHPARILSFGLDDTPLSREPRCRRTERDRPLGRRRSDAIDLPGVAGGTRNRLVAQQVERTRD